MPFNRQRPTPRFAKQRAAISSYGERCRPAERIRAQQTHNPRRTAVRSLNNAKQTLYGRCVGVLLANDSDPGLLTALRSAVEAEGRAVANRCTVHRRCSGEWLQPLSPWPRLDEFGPVRREHIMPAVRRHAFAQTRQGQRHACDASARYAPRVCAVARRRRGCARNLRAGP